MQATRTIGRRGLAVGLAATIVAGGCAASAQVVSDHMAASYLPYLGRSGGFGDVPDWRRLTHPSGAMRSYFEDAGATYRVIAAARDRATLVVWKADSPGAQPFDGNVRATGHGCVTLRRSAVGVRSGVVACPAHLGPPPGSYQTSWGRDSAARHEAENVVAAIVGELTWLMNHEPDGRPRYSTRTSGQVMAAARSAWHGATTRLRVDPTSPAPPGRARATITVSATAADPVDTRRSVTARTCALLAVHLDGDATGVRVTPVRCR